MSEAVCYALLLADKVFKEDNGKSGVVGIFNMLHFSSFPAPVTFPWSIFVGLANIDRKITISINLVHDETLTVVLPLSFDVELKEGNSIEFGVPGPSVVFPKPGKYTLTLNVDGQQVQSRTLEVVAR
jgi:hypothetical protein